MPGGYGKDLDRPLGIYQEHNLTADHSMELVTGKIS